MQTIPTIEQSSFEELRDYYDTFLNTIPISSSNDIPTPMRCVIEMFSKLPEELWGRPNLRILDPCCGNGNFHLPIFYKLKTQMNNTYNTNNIHNKTILENSLVFNDINPERLKHVREIFCGHLYDLAIHQSDFLTWDAPTTDSQRFDLIVANPPYAKRMNNGERASKNHNLIQAFLTKSLELLKPNGYLMFITPDNWMSYADRNLIVQRLTALQIIHLDIHRAKTYFKKVGSSFTWYIIKNCPCSSPFTVSGIWKKWVYEETVPSGRRSYIPLLYTAAVHSILSKTIDHPTLERFKVETNSDLHRYTRSALIQNAPDELYQYRLIHTPKQTVWASRPHKYQQGYKVFISTTDKYAVFIDNCGMTQSIAFIRCQNLEEAQMYKKWLEHPLYVFLNNICRWGNFNNIRILQRFPIPPSSYVDVPLYDTFHLTPEEIRFIEEHR